MNEKFGVCNYDFDGYNPKIENLEIFDSYGAAFNRYLTRAMETDNFGYVWDKTLWYVWIVDNLIVQFEQLTTKSRCRRVEIDGI